MDMKAQREADASKPPSAAVLKQCVEGILTSESAAGLKVRAMGVCHKRQLSWLEESGREGARV